MTLCPSGRHPFPVEDSSGAYCREHGVTLLWHGDQATSDNIPAAPTDDQQPT